MLTFENACQLLEQVNEVDIAIGAVPNEEGEDEDENDASAKAVAEDFRHKLEGQNARFEEEMKEAVEAQEQLKHQIVAKQEEEQLRLEVEMKRDAEAFEAKMKAEQDHKMRQLEEQKLKMEQEISHKTQASSEDERKMLLDMHETKMNQMEKVYWSWRLVSIICHLCACVPCCACAGLTGGGEQEAKSRKAADEELLRQKLEARKRKKQAQVQQRQREELLQAEKSGQELTEAMSRRKKASAFAELRSMVADGKIEEAVGLLRATHEQEMIEMRARQTRDFSRAMVSLSAGADTAEAEAKLSDDQKGELAALEMQQGQEVVALQEGSKLPFDEPEDQERKAEEEKAARAQQIMLHAQQVKAQMEEELQRMEAQIHKCTFCPVSMRHIF